MSLKEKASNAEWMLLEDEKGSIYVKSTKTNETKPIQEIKINIREMKSLIALLEGSGVKIE